MSMVLILYSRTRCSLFMAPSFISFSSQGKNPFFEYIPCPFHSMCAYTNLRFRFLQLIIYTGSIKKCKSEENYLRQPLNSWLVIRNGSKILTNGPVGKHIYLALVLGHSSWIIYIVITYMILRNKRGSSMLMSRKNQQSTNVFRDDNKDECMANQCQSAYFLRSLFCICQ